MALVAATSIWLPLSEQQVSGATTANLSQQTPVVFVEVSSAQSKISWTHDNGRSEARHLPETCGGGGLFFDFDNDGWLDIYFVNSGPSDFYSPKTPIRNALYRNNRDGSFSDVTEKAGVACGKMGHFGMGAAARTMMATVGKICTSPTTVRMFSFTITERNFH